GRDGADPRRGGGGGAAAAPRTALRCHGFCCCTRSLPPHPRTRRRACAAPPPARSFGRRETPPRAPRPLAGGHRDRPARGDGAFGMLHLSLLLACPPGAGGRDRLPA